MTQSNENRHTPAPWDVFYSPSSNDDTEDSPKMYAFNGGSDLIAEHDANARLIAAAPELLEALEMAKGVIELGLAQAKLQNAYSSEKIDTHGIKRAIFLAIAKAKGE